MGKLRSKAPNKSLPEKRKSKRKTAARLLRNPDLLFFWSEKGFLARDLRTGRETVTRAEIVSVLDFFSRPRRRSTAAEAFGKTPAGSTTQTIDKLLRLGLLVSEPEGRRRTALLKIWKNNVASAHYHGACRDAHYLQRIDAVRKYLRGRVASERRPAPFKRYSSRFRRPLHRPETPELSSTPLGEVLESRRTVRSFSREAVRFEDLAAVVGGTWGQTGWIVDKIVGRLLSKTSPSSGALHPIECYVLAWNVRGLPAGLYHFDVASDGFRRLRPGDFRDQAVRAASGQRWIRGAAFLCVMAAVFTRNLWKYQWDRAYRSVWLDAGHLAQTFSLLATARGLGPFTTAAIQDSYIEKLIGLDGVKEFPIYLCGAGMPSEPLLHLSR